MTSWRIEEELECPICFDRFNIPKVLPCQHTFCANCLEGLNERGNVRCPECRVIHTVPASGFPINITMQRLLSASETPNNQTSAEPTHESEIRRPVEPSAPPLEPPPARLPPVYPLPNQPVLEHPAQNNQFHQPHVPQSHHPQTDGPIAQNRLPPGGQTQHPPVYVSQPQPLPSIQTQRETDIQPSTVSCQAARTTETGNVSENENNFDQCKTTLLKYFKIIREEVRKIISHFLRKYKNFMAVTTVVFLVITFSRFVAGAVKLSSDCPKEKRVAEYLFVKAWLGFIFWGMLLLLGCKKQLMNAMDNRFVEVYVFIESLFSLIWLIIGTVWTIGFRGEMINECPFDVEKWNKNFINFALFLTVLDWIGIGAFGIYCCYVKCDKSDDDAT